MENRRRTGTSPAGARGRQPAAEAAPTARLLAIFDGHRLSPAQRRIAQYLLDHITDAAFLSITDLAERVGVSQPSVTRFASALGFSGFPALRDALHPIALSAIAASPDSPEEIRRNELQAAVDAEIANLESLRRLLSDPSPVIEVGHNLAHSVPMAVLGVRISVSLAEYFAYAAKRIHPDVRVITSGGSVANDALLQVKEAGGTWALAFAMPRYSNETLAAVQAAKETGLQVALITDQPLGPLAHTADIVLSAGTGSRLVFDSYAAPVVLTATLLQAMADALPERTQARLEAYEQVADRHTFFLPES
ncbi:MurR/RpiR family transcriptional regulator [Kitasatospora atroaurantiaca]|uniref:RpiR family transcriptional regulator n=1 Tax=Kitasatospora atroaurantiaca TaxID=285545 RepID=A0A561F0M0_9ACTN|nr:MurR/RpiR family transcriptional regulator [Kitasatospora atroaurantiaca]TWE21408.1 RpiR family transcriptional regulator [Kitasatospora atroaurantiaca]